MNSPIAIVHGTGSRHQRLAGYLSAEDSLAVLLRRSAAKDVDLDDFEVEEGDEVVEGLSHVSIMPQDHS
jgi:hypothetical protein